MKLVKFIVFLGLFMPVSAFAAGGDFATAARLLNAAKNADIQQVQVLISNGADVNYVDDTGVSIVCTAIMNNDLRAAQILQMYGADSSQCDRQIRNYQTRNSGQTTDTGFFSGLSTAQGLVLAGAGIAVVVGGLYLLTDVFDHDNDNHASSGSSSGGGGGGGSSSGSGTAWSAGELPYGPAMVNATQENANYATNLSYYSTGDMAGNFEFMNSNPNQNYNYLLLMRGYSPLARGYLGMRTLRNSEHKPVILNGAMWGSEIIGGGQPVNVALVTANGINATTNTSLENKYLVWAGVNSDGSLGAASNETISSKYYNNILTVNATDDYSVVEDTSFDLSGAGTAIHNTAATDMDNMLAKIVGGNDTGYTGNDFFGFMPNGQMTIYRTGGDSTTDYLNYSAILDAANKKNDMGAGRSRVDIIANLDVIEPLHLTDAKTINDILSVASTDYKTTFAGFVGAAYGTSDVDNLPATNAGVFFNSLGINYNPLTIFSTGASKTDSNYSGAYQVATFENAAPLVYNNINHLFMSVVAVGALTADGTITANSDGNANKYQLAKWQDVAGTGDYYKARVCGRAGLGGGNIDPWCFAAVGLTDEMATAAAAGAAGVLRSAFYYMTPQQIFTLLALTADGPFLHRLSSGTQLNEDTLVSYLQSMYEMPEEFQYAIDNGENYLDVFKQVYGYGVINLERATTPGTNLYYYTNGKIVSTSGNAYWRAAANTGFRASPALNLGRAAVNVAAYDMLENIDGSMRLPRVWETSVTLGANSRSALYMGDVLGDLRVRADTDDMMNIGNMSFGFTRSARAYNDNMGGLDTMKFGFADGNWNLAADYQRYLTDGESRFTGMANPILSLASNAITGGADYKYRNWTFGARAFSGAITDEGLLENDPTISSLNEPMRLGTVAGAQSEIAWHGERFGLKTSLGSMHENNSILGAYATGLMGIGDADTKYVDIDASWKLMDMLKLRGRATFAWTNPNMAGGAMVDISELNSNAFALGADIGNLQLTASLPLSVMRGSIKYDYADYEIVDDGNGHYDLVINDCGPRRIDISPAHRELRFGLTYRHNFGSFTDGAIGFIYRINPNNIDEFGNESIFMFKMSHRMGI